MHERVVVGYRQANWKRPTGRMPTPVHFRDVTLLLKQGSFGYEDITIRQYSVNSFLVPQILCTVFSYIIQVLCKRTKTCVYNTYS